MLQFQSGDKSPGFVQLVRDIKQLLLVTVDSGAQMSVDGFHFVNIDSPRPLPSTPQRRHMGSAEKSRHDY